MVAAASPVLGSTTDRRRATKRRASSNVAVDASVGPRRSSDVAEARRPPPQSADGTADWWRAAVLLPLLAPHGHEYASISLRVSSTRVAAMAGFPLFSLEIGRRIWRSLCALQGSCWRPRHQTLAPHFRQLACPQPCASDFSNSLGPPLEPKTACGVWHVARGAHHEALACPGPSGRFVCSGSTAGGPFFQAVDPRACTLARRSGPHLSARSRMASRDAPLGVARERQHTAARCNAQGIDHVPLVCMEALEATTGNLQAYSHARPTIAITSADHVTAGAP